MWRCVSIGDSIGRRVSVLPQLAEWRESKKKHCRQILNSFPVFRFELINKSIKYR